MRIPLYHVDAFTSEVFSGNPAAVCLLDRWLDDPILQCRGVIITARGERCDFVSCFFAPRLGIPEDPVTGSSHSVLAPYWAGRLGKKDLHVFQVSKRGGELFCTHASGRVKISGQAVLYMKGMIIV